MAKQPKEYRKLCGPALRRLGSGLALGGIGLALTGVRSTFWLGPDHVLSVDTEGTYQEFYKRFYYTDIQALIVRKTNSGKIGTIIFAVIALLLFASVFFITDAAGRIALAVVAGIFGLLALANWLSGPTCVCHLLTAVSCENVPALNRVRKYNKALAKLRPFLEQAQGAAGGPVSAVPAPQGVSPSDEAAPETVPPPAEASGGPNQP